MICHCTMAGTQACKNCPRYIEQFGKRPYQITYSHELATDEERLKKMVKEAVKEIMRGEE